MIPKNAVFMRKLEVQKQKRNSPSKMLLITNPEAATYGTDEYAKMAESFKTGKFSVPQSKPETLNRKLSYSSFAPSSNKVSSAKIQYLGGDRINQATATKERRSGHGTLSLDKFVNRSSWQQ